MPSHWKKRVRARMAKTGESWTTALRNVRAQAGAKMVPPPREPLACDATVQVRPPPPPRTLRKEGIRKACLLFATVRGEQVVELRTTARVGRDPKCAIQLLDKLVAKEHCILECREGRLVLRDLGSLNGTYVNGERVRGEHAVAHGDEIALGATRARYDDGLGPMSFPPPDIGPGAVEPPAQGGWRPPGGNSGGGAPSELGIGPMARVPTSPPRLN
jgi:hypothetical protein